MVTRWAPRRYPPPSQGRASNSSVAPKASVHADPADQRHPHVSPVYGDFSKGFAPTLIQGGTRELFLSHFVRLYRAIDAAGGTAVLDLHEGMPHGFASMAPTSDESAAAFDRAQRFFAEHLPR